MGGSPPPQQDGALGAFIQHLFSGTDPRTIIPAAIIAGAVIVAVFTQQPFPPWAVVVFGIIIAVLTLVPQYQDFVQSRDGYRLERNAQQNKNFLAINITVLDQESDEPIADAEVALLVAQRVTGTTNSNGLAVMAVAGALVKEGVRYEMIVTHTGYQREKKEVSLYDGFSDLIRLVPLPASDDAQTASNQPNPEEARLLRGVPLSAFPSDRNLYNDIVTFITPYVQSTGTRRSLVLEAFWDESIVDKLDYTGSASVFAAHLVETAQDYNDSEAIIRLLTALRNDVGTNKQAQIDALIRRIQGTQSA